jgi:AcrR family transcriptional regulator
MKGQDARERTPAPPRARERAEAETVRSRETILRLTQPQRRAAAERRVLDATASLIGQGGSSTVTLADVGREAGYSRGIVTHHFGTKEALLAKLAAAAQERVAPPAGHEMGLGRLRLLVDTYIQSVQSGDSYARAFLLLWAESVSASPALRAIFAERDQQFISEIVKDLEAGRRQGTVHPGIDSVGTAAALIAQLRGLALQIIIAGDSFDAERARDAIQTGLLRSLATEKKERRLDNPGPA